MLSGIELKLNCKALSLLRTTFISKYASGIVIVKNILIIPHQPSFDIKVRSLEIAKILAQSYNTYYLTWQRRESSSFSSGLKLQLSSLFAGTQIGERCGFSVVSGLSKLYRPFCLAWCYNGAQLKKLIKRYSIDVVINAESGLYAVPKFQGIYIYDLVDDAFSPPNTHGQRRQTFVGNEISKADYVITVSKQLCRLIRENWGREATLIPNGANVQIFHNSDKQALAKLNSALGILDKEKIIGFVGNFEKWTGLEFLIDVFTKLKETTDNISLLIVGGGVEAERLSKRYSKKDKIIFTGVVPPDEVHNYFNIIDVGVIPFELSDFTHNAFPIKAIEYSCAKSIIVSTPLNELIDHNFPNIIFAYRSIENWLFALKQALAMKWNNSWNTRFIQYDWSEIVGQIIGLIKNRS